ncbi:MAG: 4Fe-4S binding protein [Treponema sp.]|nr:4Fe-4S binding protein [Treponema sp.]
MNTIRRRRLHSGVRWALLLGVLGWITWEFIAHAYVSKVHPSVHALCPLGGLESLLAWIVRDGATLLKIFSATLGLFFVSAGISILFKRSFCGSVCPLGTLQDLAGVLGRAVLGRNRFRLPPGPDRILRLLKYPVLVLSVASAWITGTLWIQSFDPWPAYAHLFNPSELFPTYAVGFGILAASLVLSFFLERAFCKYLCPMGAFTAVLGLASPFKVRRDAGAFFLGVLVLQALGFDRVSGRQEPTLRELARDAGMTTAEFRDAYGLPSGFYAGARAGAVEDAIPLYKMAELNGTDSARIKEDLGLDPALPDDTPWGEAFGAVTLGRLAELNGVTLEALKAYYSLPSSAGPDTPWRDVRKAAEKAAAASGGGGGRGGRGGGGDH